MTKRLNCSKDILLLILCVMFLAHFANSQIACNRQLCYNGICENGENSNVSRCFCHEYFTGTLCEMVNMRIPSFEFMPRGLKFTWKLPINLDDYFYMYRQQTFTGVFSGIFETDDKLNITQVFMDHNDTLDVVGFKEDGSRYVLCIVHRNFVPSVNNSYEMMDILDPNNINCGNVVPPHTDPRFYYAAIWIASGIIILTVFLMTARVIDSCRNQEKRDLVMADVRKSMRFLRHVSSKNRTHHNNPRRQNGIL